MAVPQLDDPDWRVHQRREGKRCRHHADGREVRQLAGDDHRADGVADRAHPDLADREQVVAGDVEAEQDGHPGEADPETG